MDKEAKQIYQFTDKNLCGQYECYCSECGNLVISMCYPTERRKCPHCGSKFNPRKTITYKEWLRGQNERIN